MVSKDEEYLDIDWLLGEEDSKRNAAGSLWSGTVFCLGIAAIAVWSWPYLSKWYLQRQYVAEFKNSDSTDQAIQSLAMLGHLMPQSARDVLEALRSNDPAALQLASELLQQEIERLHKSTTETDRASLQQWIVKLDRIQNRLSTHGRSRARDLVERIVDLCREKGTLVDTQTLTLAEPLLASLTNAHPNGTTIASTSGDSIPLDSVPSRLSSMRSDSQVALVASSPKGEKIRISDRPAESETMPLEKGATIQGSEAALQNTIPSNSYAKVTPELIEENSSKELVKPVIVAKAPTNDTMQLPSDPTIVVRAIDDGRSTMEWDQDQGGIISDASIGGLQTIETGHVIRLLASSQERLSNAAFAELQRRQFSQEHLELALTLARGSRNERMAAMTRILHLPLNPIPWLAWMAEVGEHDVRHRAVSLLSSLNDPEARVQLRYLLQREREKDICDQIQHGLQLVGTRTIPQASLR